MADADIDVSQGPDPATEADTADVEAGRPGFPGYAPSAVEVTRGRAQGLGMGASDLDAQIDSTTRESARRLADVDAAARTDGAVHRGPEFHPDDTGDD